mgnify:CR=1 FL=1|jgi:hypothetical protein
MHIDIDDKIIDDINEYCELNGITDVNSFFNKSIRDGFNSIKYGHRLTVQKKPKENLDPKPITPMDEAIIEVVKTNRKNIYGENE